MHSALAAREGRPVMEQPCLLHVALWCKRHAGESAHRGARQQHIALPHDCRLISELLWVHQLPVHQDGALELASRDIARQYLKLRSQACGVNANPLQCCICLGSLQPGVHSQQCMCSKCGCWSRLKFPLQFCTAERTRYRPAVVTIHHIS